MLEEEYLIITSKKDLLEKFSTTGYIKGLPIRWLKQVTNIYTKYTRKITGSCDSCRASMLRWLIKNIKEYEANSQNGQ